MHFPQLFLSVNLWMLCTIWHILRKVIIVPEIWECIFMIWHILEKCKFINPFLVNTQPVKVNFFIYA